MQPPSSKPVFSLQCRRPSGVESFGQHSTQSCATDTTLDNLRLQNLVCFFGKSKKNTSDWVILLPFRHISPDCGTAAIVMLLDTRVATKRPSRNTVLGKCLILHIHFSCFDKFYKANGVPILPVLFGLLLNKIKLHF
jgi:hypothetical protein